MTRDESKYLLDKPLQGPWNQPKGDPTPSVPRYIEPVATYTIRGKIEGDADGREASDGRTTETQPFGADARSGSTGDSTRSEPHAGTTSPTPSVVEAAREAFFAIRLTSGELIYGEYGWMACDGPDDWTVAEESNDASPTEYEIVRMHVESLARRTFGTPDAECLSCDEPVDPESPDVQCIGGGFKHRTCPDPEKAEHPDA